MKKVLSILFCMILSFALTACGGSEAADTVSAAKDAAAASTESETAATEADIPFEALTVVDNDDFCFRITDVDPDDFWGYTFNAFCENKTDRNLTFSMDRVVVNGYACDPLWAEEVAAGMKSNSDISFSDTALARFCESVDELRFVLRVYDTDDWSADNLLKDEFVLYPTGKTADQITVAPLITTPEEKVLIDDENCAFIILGVHDDEIWGYTLDCCMENKTDVPMMFSVDDAAVNGFMADPFWAHSVPANARSYSEISFSHEALEENQIENVEQIQFQLHIYDDDSMETDFYEDTVTYEPAG